MGGMGKTFSGIGVGMRMMMWGWGRIYVPMQQQQENSEVAVVNGGCMGFDKNCHRPCGNEKNDNILQV